MPTYAKDIYNQYNTMPVSELVDYYQEHQELITRMPHQIKTIGVYYHGLSHGGLERVISLLIPVWLRAKYKIVLLTEDEPSPEDFPYPQETVRVVLPCETAGIQNRLLALEEAFLLHHIDVFIHNDWMDYKLLPEMLLIKRHHIPFILYTHGQFSVIYRYYNAFSSQSHRVFSLCDLVLTLSDVNRRFYQMCGCRCRVIQNPIAPELMTVQPNKSADDNHTVVWVGRFSSEKRPHDALQVIKHVSKELSDVRLMMLGTGSEAETESLKKYCTDLDLDDRVVFCGHQSDLAKYYSSAAALLMTSDTEGYPNVLIEAKAHGRAIVMYHLPDLTLTKSGLGVVTAPVGKISALADELIGALRDADLRHRLEEETIESFREFVSYDQQALWREIFTELETGTRETYKIEPEKGRIGRTEREGAESVRESENVKQLLPLLLRDFEFACKRSQKAMETYPDFRVGKAVLRLPRMVKHLLKR